MTSCAKCDGAILIERLKNAVEYWRARDLESEKIADELRAEIARLQAALAKKQEPDGEREEQVADWLRSRGYTVTRIGKDGSG